MSTSRRDRSDLDILIKEIEDGTVTNYSSIPSAEKLLHHLHRLKKFIGNTRLKRQTVEQLRYILYKLPHLDKLPNAECPMLHMVLDGDPGCGKTTVCEILAGIWCSTGYLRRSRIKQSAQNTEGNISFRKTRTVSYTEHFVIAMICTVMLLLMFGTVIYAVICACCREDRSKGFKFCMFMTIAVLVLLVIWWFLIYNSKPVTVIGDGDNDVIAATYDKDFTANIITTKGTDWVGAYMGHTEKFVNDLVRDNEGSVITIDEAYEIMSSSKDMYGKKALTIINATMSEKPRSFIFVFMGYRKDIEKLYEYQSGLRSRIPWNFACDSYTPEDLYNILIARCVNEKLPLDEGDVRTKAFVIKNANNGFFKYYGRDVRNLVNAAERKFVIDGESQTIRYEHFLMGAFSMAENSRDRGVLEVTDDDLGANLL